MMKLILNYIYTFQYHGPYRIVVELPEHVAATIQNAGSEDQLKEALATFLFGDLFIKCMKDEWKWPPLTEQESGSSCDRTAEDLLYSIRRWFEQSLPHHTVEVFRITDQSPNEHTSYTVHEEIVDGFEDQHLHISIEHDGLANPKLKDTHLVLTEEERTAQNEEDAYMASLWDD